MSEDKEKKIAEIEEKYDRSGYLYGEQEEWLINQLKECREEIDRPLLSDGEFNEAQMKREIEQRTKDACCKAGFKWVLAHMPSHGLTHGASEESFKQAIDSVGGK